MNKRASYQHGSVIRKMRERGPDVWVFRYKDHDGIQRAKRIGTVEKYPTKAGAQKKAAKLLEQINEHVNCIKIAGLCDRYLKEGLPARESTAGPYRSYLKKFRDQWGDWRTDEMARDVMAIEQWIDGLETIATPDRISARGEAIKGRPARPMAKKSKQLMKGFVHRLFELAIKWGYISMQRNPISLVEIKGRAKRTRPLILLTGEQYRALMADAELAPHVRTMIAVAMLLGLRASEFLGLRWEDVDFERRVLSIRRSYVGKAVDETKTEDSAQELPMHDDLIHVLNAWKEAQPSVDGWLFGNSVTKRPFWRGQLQQDHLVPAGERIGIPRFGWHAFRHTYRAMMRELKIPLEEQRTLMRHSDIKTTLGYGGKTPAEHGRQPNGMVVEMLRRQA